MGAKANFLEGSAHIPLIIKPPSGFAEKHGLKGKKIDSIVDLADIMPTVLNIAGAELPKDLDGEDLFELAENQGDDRTFYGSCEGFMCIIEDYYKYIWTDAGGDELLFNLKNDLKEENNLSKNPEHADRMKIFRKKLLDFCLKYDLKKADNDKIIHGDAPAGQQDVEKWPGFHSKTEPSDVLH